MRTVYTRQELYDLVWSKPIVKLAEQFGLSDKGLAKTCAKYQIPVPGRGYWARLEAGQPLTKTPLWKIDNPFLQSVHIGGSRSRKTPHEIQISTDSEVAQRRIDAQDAHVNQTGKSAGVEIKTARDKLHPSLSEFHRKLVSAKLHYTGATDLYWTKVPPDLIPRVMAFLNSLAFALEPYGIVFRENGTTPGFGDGMSHVHFQITSPRKETKKGWREYSFVGRLTVHFYGRADGVTKKWEDKGERRIEADISNIVNALRLHIEAEKEHDARKRLADERREALARRHELAQLRREREDRRSQFFNELAAARREAVELRHTLSMIPEGEVLPPDYSRMLQWARSRLQHLEDQTSIENMQQILVEDELFPEIDDLDDPEGDPPPRKVNAWGGWADD